MKHKSNQKRRSLYENKQLQHDLQLCKIDLAQRDFQLNNLKLEYQQKIENLEEKCSDLSYKNQMLNAKLNSTIAVSFETPLNYKKIQMLGIKAFFLDSSRRG